MFKMTSRFVGLSFGGYFRSLLMGLGLIAMMLQTSCRTTAESESKAQLSFYDQLPKVGDCPQGPGLLECKHFEEGAGGDTAERVTSSEAQVSWIRDLAQLYAFHKNQLGKEFDKNIYKDLSFERDQVLAIVDQHSTKAGRHFRLEKIEKIDGHYTVYVTLWQPKEVDSKCEQFSFAVLRPYLFLKVKRSHSVWEDKDAELTIVKTNKFYQCHEGQVIE